MTTPDSQAFSTVVAGSNRSFGVVFVVVFLVIATYPLLSDAPVRSWALIVALVLLVPTLFRPSLLKPLNMAWFKFGMLLGRIINPVVMLLIYAIAIVPTGLAMRMLGKDPLRLRFDPSSPSYWIERHPPGPTPQSMEDQF